MAKSKKILGKIADIFWIGKTPDVPAITDTSYRSISDKEMQRFVSETYVANSENRPKVDPQQIPQMLEPLSRDLVDRRMDYEKLRSLAPEIDQAASILIPSILAPNDFSKNIFNIVIEGEEDESVKTKVIELLVRHFSDELDLSVKLSDWVTHAKFNMGSKAVLLLPTNTIGNIRDAIGMSTEALESRSNSLLDEIEASVESISGASVRHQIYTDDEIVDRVVATGMFDSIDESGVSKVRSGLKSGFRKAVSELDTVSKIKFVDDPKILVKSRIVNGGALESVSGDILKKLGVQPKPFFADRSDGIAGKGVSKLFNYANIPYIDLGDFVHEDKVSAYPAMIELPSESVIPIIIEGAPSNHIGYFVMLNENGLPISAEVDNFETMINSASGSQRINNIYASFYGSSQFSLQKKMSLDAKTEVLNAIYDSYIGNVMKAKLNKMKLDKYNVNLTNDISRVMFSRLLKNSETRILFVPKSLLHYMAFEYYADGTGKSKVDNIKFPLSLKMTFIITRLISLIESSINRRSLKITLDKNIGNPLELLRAVKKEVASNKIYGLSYDPSTIIKNVIDKELTIVPSNIPGVENFELSDVPNNVEYPRPDDAILEEITNMYMMNLGIPPSAMNRLSEDEFSRSVASNNIFFSNQIRTDQRVVVRFMTSLISTYVSFSSQLKELIIEIMKSAKDVSGTIEGVEESVKVPADSTEATEASKDTDEIAESVEGSTEAAKSKKDKEKPEPSGALEDRFANLLSNIKFTLPAPNLAHDKASFDELEEYIKIVDTVLLNLYPDDMTLDTELASVVKVLRSTMKHDILKEHIQANSLLADLNFDALSNVEVTRTVESNQKLLNLKKALESLIKVFSEATDAGGETTPGW